MAIHTCIDSRQLEMNFVSKSVINTEEVSQTVNIIDLVFERKKLQIDKERCIEHQLLSSLLSDAQTLKW